MVLLMGFTILLQFANLKMAIEIVDFSIKKMVISHSFLYVYQRYTETIRNI